MLLRLVNVLGQPWIVSSSLSAIFFSFCRWFLQGGAFHTPLPVLCPRCRDTAPRELSLASAALSLLPVLLTRQSGSTTQRSAPV